MYRPFLSHNMKVWHRCQVISWMLLLFVRLKKKTKNKKLLKCSVPHLWILSKNVLSYLLEILYSFLRKASPHHHHHHPLYKCLNFRYHKILSFPKHWFHRGWDIKEHGNEVIKMGRNNFWKTTWHWTTFDCLIGQILPTDCYDTKHKLKTIL